MHAELDHLHSLGIGHYNIKPDNILIDRKRSLVYLIDFEFAQWLTAKDGSALDVQRDTGCPHFRHPELRNRGAMSPVKASPAHDRASLIYSLATLLMRSSGVTEGLAAIGRCLRDTATRKHPLVHADAMLPLSNLPKGLVEYWADNLETGKYGISSTVCAKRHARRITRGRAAFFALAGEI